MNKLLITTILASAALLVGCDDGDTGPMGLAGAPGADGANGADGSNGLTSLVRQDALSVGDANCPNSGTAINSGLDDNSDGALQDSEIDETSFTCVPGRISLTTAELNTSLSNTYFSGGQKKVAETRDAVEDVALNKRQAKNVILFIGDGMGVSTVTAARILDGQDRGLPGEENQLSFGKFPFAGLAKTYNVDAQTPDSAGTMTAMVTGVKTDVGTIGYDEDVVRGTCEADDTNELVTALELAELADMSTGVISTARITHATPAATYAR